MQSIVRAISLKLRKLDAGRDRRRVLERFDAERRSLGELAPPANRATRELMIVRLDDIGDYLLFRHHLALFKQSPRWRDHRITLLGNESWREIFTTLDASTVDETLWVDKERCLSDAAYRAALWPRLRSLGVDTVVAPSRTRPLLLDDLCVLALAPRRSIGCANTHVHEDWNRLSDALFDELFTVPDPLLHESRFNQEFAAWVCGMPAGPAICRIEVPDGSPLAEPYWIGFVGSNTRSKRWPVSRWIEFISAARQRRAGRIVLAGRGAAELEMVRRIQARVEAESIAGAVSLPTLLQWIGGAQAVITNDTMAGHLGVALRRPTVIVANGVNYLRFSEYARAGVEHARSVYPEVFLRRRERLGDGPYGYSEAVSADIASISGARVLEALEDLLSRAGEGLEWGAGVEELDPGVPSLACTVTPRSAR